MEVQPLPVDSSCRRLFCPEYFRDLLHIIAQFYFWANFRKVSIMLEEIEMEYEVHSINISKGEQKEPEFLKISPNNKIPVIVDRDNGLSLMESGVILQYLARKSGQLMPENDTDYWKMQEWLMFQMASV